PRGGGFGELGRHALAGGGEVEPFALGLMERAVEKAVQLGEVAARLVEHARVEAELRRDREGLARAGKADAQLVRRAQRRRVELDAGVPYPVGRERERLELRIMRGGGDKD